MGDRLSSLGDDNFFALTDAIEELDDVSGGFGEGDVGDHEVDLLYDLSIVNRGGRAIVVELEGCGNKALWQIRSLTHNFGGFGTSQIHRCFIFSRFSLYFLSFLPLLPDFRLK